VLWVLCFAGFAGRISQEATAQETRAQHAAPTASALVSGKIAVYFSPSGGAQEAVIREVGAAKQSILIQAYSFTSAPIAQALLAAQKRGVKVEAVLDKSNETAQYTSATFLQNAGAKVFIDFKPAIAHSKIMLIDLGTPGATLITGSFNFTKSAQERNTENLLVIKEAPELMRAYEANYRARAALSRPYARTKPVAGAARDSTADDSAADDSAADDGESETTVPVTAVAPVPTTDTPTTTTPTTPTSALLNLNTATAKDLEKLPGIGKVSAERIIAYRTANGAFKSVDDLGQVKGIGKAALEKMRALVDVN
jgi:comEA protein